MLTHTHAHPGDSGYTTLTHGSRTRKDAPLLAAHGELDEAGTALGAAASSGCLPEQFDALLRDTQQTLFHLGRSLLEEDSPPETAALEELEAVCQRYAREPLPDEPTVLASRSTTVTHLLWARAVTRRAERTLWTFVLDEQHPPLRYAAVTLNRLADVLMLAAALLHRGVIQEFPLGICGGATA